MKRRRWVFASAVLLVLPHTLPAQQPQVLTKAAPTAAEASAIAQEQQVLQAVVRGDVAGINAALGNPRVLMVGSDGISIWTPEGVAAFTSECTTKSEKPSGFTALTASKDIVVLAYKSEGDQVCRGRPSPLFTNALSVWQRKGGRWSVLAHSETPPAAALASPAASAHPFDGVYLYLPPLKGMAVYSGDRFSFVFGPADGSGSMSTNAGTYAMAGDTAVATVLFSAGGGAQPGSRFRFLIRPLAADTVAYTLVDSAGRPVGSGRTLKLRQ